MEHASGGPWLAGCTNRQPSSQPASHPEARVPNQWFWNAPNPQNNHLYTLLHAFLFVYVFYFSQVCVKTFLRNVRQTLGNV